MRAPRMRAGKPDSQFFLAVRSVAGLGRLVLIRTVVRLQIANASHQLDIRNQLCALRFGLNSIAMKTEPAATVVPIIIGSQSPCASQWRSTRGPAPPSRRRSPPDDSRSPWLSPAPRSLWRDYPVRPLAARLMANYDHPELVERELREDRLHTLKGLVHCLRRPHAVLDDIGMRLTPELFGIDLSPCWIEAGIGRNGWT